MFPVQYSYIHYCFALDFIIIATWERYSSREASISLSHPLEDLSPGKSYHLKWSGHAACLADQFEGSDSRDVKSEGFTDVTIIAGLDIETSAVRSHRILLSASSDYFLVSFVVCRDKR